MWDRLLGLAWSAAYLGLYAARLPATYQHGRYAIRAGLDHPINAIGAVLGTRAIVAATLLPGRFRLAQAQ